jgi:hypothetical protein
MEVHALGVSLFRHPTHLETGQALCWRAAGALAYVGWLNLAPAPRESEVEIGHNQR